MNHHSKCTNPIGRDLSFCRSKRWHVFRVRSHHFSTYMMHLFRDGLLLSTIISHRTSVASVLHHWVYDPAANPHIKLLIGAFRLERPVQRRIMLKWDLHLVLLSLLRPPFASDGDVDGESSDDIIPLKWRTMKCVFLLALASGYSALRRFGCARSGKGTQFHCLKFHLGSAGEPTVCSHWYSVPYMKIPANNHAGNFNHGITQTPVSGSCCLPLGALQSMWAT